MSSMPVLAILLLRFLPKFVHKIICHCLILFFLFVMIVIVIKANGCHLILLYLNVVVLLRCYTLTFGDLVQLLLMEVTVIIYILLTNLVVSFGCFHYMGDLMHFLFLWLLNSKLRNCLDYPLHNSNQMVAVSTKSSPHFLPLMALLTGFLVLTLLLKMVLLNASTTAWLKQVSHS